MNYNIYIFCETPTGYSQYPDNYTSAIIAPRVANGGIYEPSGKIIIVRKGPTVYVIYSYCFAAGMSFGACMEFNSTAPRNIGYLLSLFNAMMPQLIAKGELLRYNKFGATVPAVERLAEKPVAVEELAAHIQRQLDPVEADFKPLPPVNIGAARGSTVTHGISDTLWNLDDALANNTTIVISDNPADENPDSYAAVLRRVSEEKAAAEKEAAQLRSQAAKTDNAPETSVKNTRLRIAVVFLTAIIIVLLVICLNQYGWKERYYNWYEESSNKVDSLSKVQPIVVKSFDYSFSDHSITIEYFGLFDEEIKDFSVLITYSGGKTNVINLDTYKILEGGHELTMNLPSPKLDNKNYYRIYLRYDKRTIAGGRFGQYP